MIITDTAPTGLRTGFTIERARGQAAYNEQILDVVLKRFQLSESYFSGIRQRLPRFYDLWRGIWTGRFHPHKNNIHIPLIYSAIWADAARKASTSLNTWPILQFFGFGPDDGPVARRWEGLISAQMKDMKLYQKEIDNFVTADLYGVSIMQAFWRREEPMRMIEEIQRAPITGEMVRTVRKGKVVTFDGPDLEPVDRLDFFPQPLVKTIDKMKWVIVRKFVDLDDLRLLVAEGVLDRGEFNRLLAEGGTNSGLVSDLTSIKRFQIRAGMDDETVRFLDKYARPVELLEMWGTVPSELSPDGVMERVITIANRRYVMRNRPNPFWHNQKPFIVFSPTPDPHYFDAPGKAEVVEKVQITANRYINQSLDVADLVIDPVWFYDKSSNLNTRNLYLRPGRFIPIDGSPNQMIQPMQMNLNGLAVANDKVDQMRGLTNMGTAIHDDVVQGLEGSDRQTAREFLGRREAAGTRLLLESKLYEEMYLEPLGNLMVWNNRQFLEAPVAIKVLGDNAQYDPVTKMPIADTRTTMTDMDIMQDYAARAMGATSQLSRMTRKQDLVQLITAMGSPLGQMVMGNINAVNFWRGVLREFEFPYVNEIFQANPAQNPLAALVQNATGGQGGLAQVPTSGQMVQGVPLPGMQGSLQGQEINAPMSPMGPMGGMQAA